MKSFKYLKAFTILSLCFFNSLFAQTYYPFPKDSAQWSVEHLIEQSFPFSDVYYTKHYGLVGDTIINSVTYSKFYGNNLNFTNDDSMFNIATAQYVGAIREDTSKKVWIRLPQDTFDIAYYDFGLNIGDTFNFNIFFIPADYGVVTAVDSILIDGKYRRQIHLQDANGMEETWIEGIGSTSGWFEYPSGGTIYGSLLCFSENDTLKYNQKGYCHRYKPINDGIEEPGYDNNIKTYPTLASNELYIELINVNISYTYSVFDVNGRIIEQNVYTNNSLEIIDTKDFPNGIYFIKLLVDEQMIVRKFIVNH